MRRIALLISLAVTFLLPVQSWATDRTDNFDRTDSTTVINSPSDGLGDYTLFGTGTWGISSNKGYTSNAASHTAVVLQTSVSNVAVQATISGTVAGAGLIVRGTDEANYFLLRILSSSLTIFYHHGVGVFDQLAISSSFTYSAGDVIKFTVDSSNNLEGFQNGTSKVGPVSNSNLSTATLHGIRTSIDTTVRFDDLSITEIVGSTPPFFQRRLQQ
jgi:hypothetical protein